MPAPPAYLDECVDHALVDRLRQRGIVIIPASPPFDRIAVRAAMMLDWLGTLAEHRSRIHKWGHLQALLEQGFHLPGYGENDVRLALAR
jgi:hypothetical protein